MYLGILYSKTSPICQLPEPSFASVAFLLAISTDKLIRYFVNKSKYYFCFHFATVMTSIQRYLRHVMSIQNTLKPLFERCKTHVCPF
jgi:hypothetical protein